MNSEPPVETSQHIVQQETMADIWFLAGPFPSDRMALYGSNRIQHVMHVLGIGERRRVFNRVWDVSASTPYRMNAFVQRGTLTTELPPVTQIIYAPDPLDSERVAWQGLSATGESLLRGRERAWQDHILTYTLQHRVGDELGVTPVLKLPRHPAQDESGNWIFSPLLANELDVGMLVPELSGESDLAVVEWVHREGATVQFATDLEALARGEVFEVAGSAFIYVVPDDGRSLPFAGEVYEPRTVTREPLELSDGPDAVVSPAEMFYALQWELHCIREMQATGLLKFYKTHIQNRFEAATYWRDQLKPYVDRGEFQFFGVEHFSIGERVLVASEYRGPLLWRTIEAIEDDELRLIPRIEDQPRRRSISVDQVGSHRAHEDAFAVRASSVFDGRYTSGDVEGSQVEFKVGDWVRVAGEYKGLWWWRVEGLDGHNLHIAPPQDWQPKPELVSPASVKARLPYGVTDEARAQTEPRKFPKVLTDALALVVPDLSKSRHSRGGGKTKKSPVKRAAEGEDLFGGGVMTEVQEAKVVTLDDDEDIDWGDDLEDGNEIDEGPTTDEPELATAAADTPARSKPHRRKAAVGPVGMEPMF